MHLTRTRRGTAAAATSLFFALAGASAAHAAATVTVTGDDGNPLTLTAGTPATIRQMDVKVGVAFPAATAARYSTTMSAPDGTGPGFSAKCYTTDVASSMYPDFRGNGNYTLTVTNYAKADTNCATPTSTETYVYAINSAVSITPPPGPFLTRNPNSYATNTLSLPVNGNPGASTYDVQYALGAVLNPDGSISGSPQQGFVSNGAIELRLTTPGTYTVVMRAKKGDFYSPWSAPVTVTALVPFDLTGVTFPDSRGPSYLIRGTVNDKTIRGTVSLALARLGKKNRYGSYRSIGKTKISSKSTFSKRFKQRRTGTYRLRIHYAGSPLAPPATITYKIRITRRLFYR